MWRIVHEILNVATRIGGQSQRVLRYMDGELIQKVQLGPESL